MNFAFDFNIAGETLSTPANPSFLLKEPILTGKEKLLHKRALAQVKVFKKAHAELLEVIMEVDKSKLYEKFLLTSTFSYCTEILKLTKDVTCTLTKIARASQHFPELKEAIASDEIHMSNARQIAHLLNHDNKTEWLEKAKCLTQDNLQKEIVRHFPKEAVQEKAKYVADKRIKLEVGLDEETMTLLKWAQDFVSQKTRSAANFEKTLKEVLTDYKEKHDPLVKAERSENRKSKEAQKLVTNHLPVARRGAEQQRRTPIPASIIHQVNLRDQRQCQAQLPSGHICGSQRWIHYHHKIEVQKGGAHSLENLTTLCSQHHHLHHSSNW